MTVAPPRPIDEPGQRPPTRGRRPRLSSQSRAILGNGAWGTLQQVVQMGGTSLLALLLIRVLPVEDYGVYAYATNLCAFGVALMTAGLAGLAVRELVARPDDNRQIVATLMVIRELFAFVALLLLTGISLTSGDPAVTAATLIACLALLGRAFDAPEMWFTSAMRTRRSALVRIPVLLVALGIRVAAVAMGADYRWFLVVFVLEPLVASALIVRAYRRDRAAPGLGRPTSVEARNLLGRSFPLLISGFANQVNLRADVVLIGAVQGAAGVAVYSAAARFSELAYFVPVMFMNASLPIMVRLRAEGGPDGGAYRRFVRAAYVRAFWLGVLVAVVVGLVGPVLIRGLFDSAYDRSATVLLVHLLACPFVYMAAVLSKWIIVEGFLWQSVKRHAVGAVINIAANLVLLPRYGLVGAAASTVASYLVASYLSCFVGSSMRTPARDMTRAIVFPLLWLLRRDDDRPSGPSSLERCGA